MRVCPAPSGVVLGRLMALGLCLGVPGGFSRAVGAQAPEPAALVVDGNGVPARRVFTEADLARLPRREVRARGHHDSAEATYAGIALSDVLRAAGAWTELSQGSPRGARAATYVVVLAADGYRAVYALAELDTAMTDKVVLLADRRDGRTLSAAEGPRRLVAPGERREARWVRQVTSLEVRRATP